MDRRTLKREPIGQNFFNFSLAVNASPQPLSKGYQQADLNQRIDTLILCNDSANARSIYLGDLNVRATPGGGLELRVGKSYVLSIANERQLYEIQGPLVDEFCLKYVESIPIVVWDISSIYVIAAAAGPTPLAVLAFRYMLT